jgi:mannose-6-phosphate isomerase-like protein (cupin superfamily)
MIGERLLMRFAGRIRHPLEHPGSSEGAFGQAESEASVELGNRENEMSGYGNNLGQRGAANVFFRRVLYTGSTSQLVLMALLPGEDSGRETYPDTDQLVRVENGCGRAVINGQDYDLDDGSVIIIPAGADHNVINTSPDATLKLHIICTPPRFPDGTVHRTKAEAQTAHQDEHA